MRSVVAFVLIMAGVVGLTREARAEERAKKVSVTVRVHDYVNIDEGSLVDAQRLVAHYYAGIGVTTTWKPTMAQYAPAQGGVVEEGLEDLSVIVLSRRMAEHRGLPINAIGSAVVGLGEIGRVAYVLYDRVARAALASSWATGDLLGVVMAHELGHLLLPAGSHSRFGLMRGNWSVTDLRRTARLGLFFSRQQGDLMRSALAADVPSRGAVRGTLLDAAE